MSPLIVAVMIILAFVGLCACSRWLASAAMALAATCVLGVVFVLAGLSKDEPKI